MPRRRPVRWPRTPSLEGADERYVLQLWLTCCPGRMPPREEVRLFRRGYEEAVLADLPARVPRKFRSQPREQSG
jgi:hypothetical protein